MWLVVAIVIEIFEINIVLVSCHITPLSCQYYEFSSPKIVSLRHLKEQKIREIDHLSLFWNGVKKCLDWLN